MVVLEYPGDWLAWVTWEGTGKVPVSHRAEFLSYRYHCRCANRPAGVMTSGSSLGSSKVAPSFSRS